MRTSVLLCVVLVAVLGVAEAQQPMQRADMMPALQGLVDKFKPILESFKSAAAGGGNGAPDAGGMLSRLSGQWSWLKDALTGAAGNTGAPAPGAQEGMVQPPLQGDPAAQAPPAPVDVSQGVTPNLVDTPSAANTAAYNPLPQTAPATDPNAVAPPAVVAPAPVVPAASLPPAGAPLAGGAFASLPTLGSIGGKAIKRSGTAVVWFAPAALDLDGAPNAYHPNNIGVDYNANGGIPGDMYGVAKTRDGRPCIQGPNDPFPGYYVSPTAVGIFSNPCSVDSWANSMTNPYYVVPRRFSYGTRKGDLGVIVDPQTSRAVWSWAADVGPADKIGETSVAVAVAFGGQPYRNGRAMCGITRNLYYVTFPNTSRGLLRTYNDVKAAAQVAFNAWGGMPALQALVGGPVTFLDSVPDASKLNYRSPSCSG